MSYTTAFENARTLFRNTANTLKPTEILLLTIRADVAKKAAEALDHANGKSPGDMLKAMQAYQPMVNGYFQKIDAQISKENIDKSKAKSALTAFKVAADKIKKDFEADLKAKAESDKETASTPKSQESVDAKAQAGAGAAKIAADRLLKSALEDFGKRRQEHLAEVKKIKGEADTVFNNIKSWHATGKQAVATATDFVSKGNIFGAKKAAKDTRDLATQAKTAANDMTNAYDVRITKGFQKDRSLGFGSYDYLKPEQRDAFLKGQTDAVDVFNTAVATGTQVLKSMEAMHLLADQLATYAQQVEELGNQKDVGEVFMKGIADTTKELAGLSTQIATDIEKAKVGQGVLLQALSLLEEIKGADQKLRAAGLAGAPLRAKGLDEKIAKLKGDAGRVKTLVNGATQSVPAAQKSNPKVKEALAKLGTEALKTLKQFNEFVAEAEKAAADLRAAK